MKAMVLPCVQDMRENPTPLTLLHLPLPSLKEEEILVEVSVCGVCRTELDEIEGRTPPSLFPIVLGHEIVGKVVEKGKKVTRFAVGDRVGIAWIHSSCGACRFCQEGRENLCAQFKATGRDAHGGYAEYAVVREPFAYPIPASFSDEEAAPLLCAGAVGYRALRLGNLHDGEVLAFSGFGASAHLVLQTARHLYPHSPLLVFTRSERERLFALDLGALWAGDFEDLPPRSPQLVIDTTPAWKPVVMMLRRLERGGRLIINAIRKEVTDREFLAKLDYAQDLWMEKTIQSVANVTRRDVEEFLEVAVSIPLRPTVETFPLSEANRALQELKAGIIRGAKVLRIRES